MARLVSILGLWEWLNAVVTSAIEFVVIGWVEIDLALAQRRAVAEEQYG